ncbi:malonyl-ACP O-methyltransferase BioC [Desulfolithobacter sp.]
MSDPTRTHIAVPRPKYMLTDKKQIGQRFARAAATYDSQAHIQYRVADRLLDLLEESGCTRPQDVLEIGCCTGLLSRRLAARFPSIQTLYCNDLVDFSASIREKLGRHALCPVFLPGDIETIDLPTRFDLIISSSTFHWLHDLPALLAKLRHHLQPGGFLAFSMYGPENLREVREVTGIGLEYPDLSTVKDMLSDHYRLLYASQHLEEFFFPDPMAILQHLRQTGVNSVRSTGWSKGRLQRFIEVYRQRFNGDQGLSLTYHPMYLVARRH